MTLACIRLAVAGALACAAGSAQAGRLEFEVASVKPAPPPKDQREEMLLRALDMAKNGQPSSFLQMSGSSVSLKNYTLAQLIAAAYKFRSDRVTGASWLFELRFDVEAKLPEGAKPEAAAEMLQALLADRFALKLHRETKTVAGFALVAGKDGPRFLPAGERTAPPSPEEMRARMEKRMQQMQGRSGGAPLASSWGSDSATMEQVAYTISNWIHAPVTDQTGLTGKYQVSLALERPESPDEPIEGQVMRAVAGVGLKLESRKTTVESIAVDSALKTPTEN